jgi:hypothetical protein
MLPVEPQHFEQAPRVDRPPSTTSSSSTHLASHSGAAFEDHEEGKAKRAAANIERLLGEAGITPLALSFEHSNSGVGVAKRSRSKRALLPTARTRRTQ